MTRNFLVSASIIAAAIFAVQPSVGHAQEEVAELRLNSRIERELAPGQIDTFRIALRSDQYLLATVEQPGIDVVVRIHDPAVSLAARGDSTRP